MNTNKLKVFSKRARLILLEGVRQRVAYWGFDNKGNAKEEVNAIEGGYIFRENVFNDPSVPRKWNALKSAIKRHSVEDIIEEAAYTWFNRLIAIKILEKNKYIDCVYEYVSSELKEPSILMKARRGDTEKLSDDQRKLLNHYIIESDDEGAFALLLTSFCRSQKLLNRLFGHIDDYTELLLPSNLLSRGGIIEHINSTDSIEEKDYKEVEFIGWLYQFYISDKKDEIFTGFKNKKKARPEDIPAATQIFTPKWIVKYMVENTIGSIWLTLHPSSELKKELRYLVKSGVTVEHIKTPKYDNVAKITLMDPSCGSGHILVEAFDIFFKMYLEEGFTTKNAVENIIKNNLFGLEIDDRAAQLAKFALLLKAAKYYPQILSTNILPNICSFPERREITVADLNLFLEPDGIRYVDQLKKNIDDLQQGKNLGSTIKIEITEEMHELIRCKYLNYEERFSNDIIDLAESGFWLLIEPYIKTIMLLAKKYSAVVTNPPYMSQRNMNAELKDYLNDNYSMSKSDLFAVFMEVCWNFLFEDGLMSMINQHSWMFLSSYEDLRNYLLNNYQIESMLHLGPKAFEDIGGEVVQSTAFVLKNYFKDGNGIYYRLVDISGSEKESHFNLYRNEYIVFAQSNFSKIPGVPIAYWITDRGRSAFDNSVPLGTVLNPSNGVQTGNNEYFLRNWSEVSYEKINNKWFPYAKGGTYRKWYGNIELVVNWENDGEEIKQRNNSCLRGAEYYFSEGLTWSDITSNKLSFRLLPKGCLFDAKGPSAFGRKVYYALGLLNSSFIDTISKSLNPTLSFQIGELRKIPYKEIDNISMVEELVKSNINISRDDWNAKETSSDFDRNELLKFNYNNKIKDAFLNYCDYWKTKFFEMYSNEVKLNKIFTLAYNLQGEIKEEVSLNDITILQDESYINDKNELEFKNDEIIKQFISYAVGCMFGRYSLNKGGLILANKGEKIEDYFSIISNPIFLPDEDGIIPCIGDSGNFSDDIVVRFKHFLEVAFSPDTLTENINFFQESLNMDLERFLTDKFWLYHCQMHKKRPIYWLFSSKRGAFKILVYMHRMNKFTIQKIRSNYLVKHLSYLRGEIDKLESNVNNLSRSEGKILDKLRSEEIECREYDKLIKDFADKQIEFDLDDGVSVNYQIFSRILAPIK